jgi:hypothetical protein
MQALEIVKIILGQPKENILWRRMIFLDALSMRFRNVKLRDQNKICQVCGPECPENEKITDVKKVDYAEFCQTNCNKYAKIKLPKENTLAADECFQQMTTEDALIDVRPPV